MKSLVLGLIALLGLTLALTTVSRADSDDARETRDALLEVEKTLRAHDTGALTAEQRASRVRALDELHRYALAGVFPHNHGTELAPIFIDEHGTLCAFANLLAFSGRLDYVKHVAATNNAAKVSDLAKDAEVVSWSRESGISIAEAATIQRPAYRPTPREDAVAPVSSKARRVRS